MNSKLIDSLKRTLLFQDIERNVLTNILENLVFELKKYSNNSVIAVESEECTSLGIVLEGSIEIQKVYASGKVVTLARLRAGSIFGEAIIFSRKNLYPATIIALENTKLMFIKNKDIIILCGQHLIIMQAFLELLSDKIFLLNKKIRELSFATIRQKIASYLIDEYNKQHNLILKLPISKQNLAEQMGIQRPSLSREFIKMREEGLIQFSKNTVTILDLDSLEDLAY